MFKISKQDLMKNLKRGMTNKIVLGIFITNMLLFLLISSGLTIFELNRNEFFVILIFLIFLSLTGALLSSQVKNYFVVALFSGLILHGFTWLIGGYEGYGIILILTLPLSILYLLMGIILSAIGCFRKKSMLL